MSIADVSAAIRLLYEADHAARTTEHDNAPINPPDDAEWIRFSIKPGDATQVSIGGSASSGQPVRERTMGIAIAQIFTPLGGGDAPAMATAEAIKATFRRTTATVPVTVQFRTPEITFVGRSAKWWQVNVTCPFFSDEVV